MIIITTPDSLRHGPISLKPDGTPDLASYSNSVATRGALQAAYGAGDWQPYTPPLPRVPTLAEAKSQITTAIRDHANNLRQIITKDVSAAESGAWGSKEVEAKIVKSGGTLPPGSILIAEAAASKKAIAVVANRIIGNADAWRGLEGTISGTTTLHLEAVTALSTVDAVLTYDWSTGWPAVG